MVECIVVLRGVGFAKNAAKSSTSCSGVPAIQSVEANACALNDKEKWNELCVIEQEAMILRSDKIL